MLQQPPQVPIVELFRQVGGRHRITRAQAFVDGSLEIARKLHSGELVLRLAMGVKRRTNDSQSVVLGSLTPSQAGLYRRRR